IIEFDVAGLEPLLSKVATACDWAGIDRRNAEAEAERKMRAANFAAEEAQRKAAQAAAVAARMERAGQYVEPCHKYPSKWCWHNPDEPDYNAEAVQFDSREAAVRHADTVLQIGH